MKSQTFLHQIEITQPGHIQVRFALDFVDDSGTVVGHRADSQGGRYHRTSIECGGDVAGTMQAVNDDLAAMGWPAVADSDIADIQSHATVAWTPEKVAAWVKLKAQNDSTFTTS